MSVFSERLKQLRIEKGENQSDVATYLEVSVQSYSAYEGSREPKYNLLKKIAKYFGVSTDYLLGASDLRTPENVSIAQETGLSDLAIIRLKQIKEMGYSGYLSELIFSSGFTAALSQINNYFELKLESEYNTIIRSEDLPALKESKEVWGATVHRSMFANMYKSLAKEKLAEAVDESFPKINETMKIINETIEELTKDIKDRKDIKAIKNALYTGALKENNLIEQKEWFKQKIDEMPLF